MSKEPVDAIITWVNGQDPLHSAKLSNYLAKESQFNSHAAPVRYAQCGEINYCVMSLLSFAPWIRTIYIVTDKQIPPIIKQLIGTPYESKVKIVDHCEIFRGYEKVLPTFNSITIECMLWRILGLSERFIYLNDDCILLHPIVYEDFFRGENIVIRGYWKVQTHKKWLYTIKSWFTKYFKIAFKPEKQDLFRAVQENSARLAGWPKHFFHSPHLPFPLKKEGFENYFNHYPDKLYQNISYRIRDENQFWPIGLIKHLFIKEEKVVIDPTLQTVSFNGSRHSLHKIQQMIKFADRNPEVAFLNMQDMSEASELTRLKVFEWLNRRIRL